RRSGTAPRPVAPRRSTYGSEARPPLLGAARQRAQGARRRARERCRMNGDELILVSVDDHICEPADMFDAHVPARYRDRAPRVVDEVDGSQQWYFGELRGRNLGLNAVAGKSPAFFTVDPLRYEHTRAWC